MAEGRGTEVGGILEAEDMRTLMDIGFMALSRGLDGPAAAVFAGVAAARPDQEGGPIGTALVKLYRGQIDEALAILRRLPPSDAVRTFLGLALSRQGDREAARRTLADVVETAGGTAFARSARDMLDAIEP